MVVANKENIVQIYVHAVSANHQLAFLGEVVLRYLEVQRRRSFPYASGNVVVGTVAGTEPATKVARLADGNATQVGAYTCRSVKLRSAHGSSLAKLEQQ